jgi:hypothetical protein
VVAHALEIVRDLERSEQETEIPGHGLVQREQVGDGLLDLDFQGVDARVLGDHPLRHLDVPMEDGPHRPVQRLLRRRRHLEEPVLEAGELVVEMAMRSGGHPNLPVT